MDELDLMHHDGDQHYYETRLKQEHAHVICLRCGKIEEFFGDLLQQMREQIESHFGFEIVLARTEVGGYCSHCQVLRAKNSRKGTGRRQPANPGGAMHDIARASILRATGRLPALAVINPSGNRSRMPLEPLPFTIGRQGENNLVLRDNRASRAHARIVADNGDYFVEDLDSRHGVFVNGHRVKRHKLTDADRIDFGFQDSYRLVFTLEDDEIRRFMEQMSTQAAAGATNLSKLRSLVEVARALQSSLSTNDVLAAVVPAPPSPLDYMKSFPWASGHGNQDCVFEFAGFSHYSADGIGTDGDHPVLIPFAIHIIETGHGHSQVIANSPFAKNGQLNRGKQDVFAGFLRAKIPGPGQINLLRKDVIVRALRNLFDAVHERHFCKRFMALFQTELGAGNPPLQCMFIHTHKPQSNQFPSVLTASLDFAK